MLYTSIQKLVNNLEKVDGNASNSLHIPYYSLYYYSNCNRIGHVEKGAITR